MAAASSAFVISSPISSIVASLPSALTCRPVSRASFNSGPAMYRSESFCTSGRGTAGSMRTIARSKIAKGGGILTLAHEALARGADERHRFREEHPHRVTERDRLLLCTAGRLELGKGRS